MSEGGMMKDPTSDQIVQPMIASDLHKPFTIATISAGFEKGDFLVREEQGARIYFDFVSTLGMISTSVVGAPQIPTPDEGLQMTSLSILRYQDLAHLKCRLSRHHNSSKRPLITLPTRDMPE